MKTHYLYDPAWPLQINDRLQLTHTYELQSVRLKWPAEPNYCLAGLIPCWLAGWLAGWPAGLPSVWLAG